MINKFSNLYSKQNELEVRLIDQQKVIDDLDDASAELMLAEEDEPVRMRVGECFWGIQKDTAEEKLEQLTDEAKQQHRQLEQQLAANREQLVDLRTKLYARLGDSINLDVPLAAGKK